MMMQSLKKRFALMSIILTLGIVPLAHGESDLTQQGIAFLKAQRFKEAIHVFSNMIKSDPNNVNAMYYRGMAQYYNDNIDAAISDYTLVLDKNPNLVDVYTSRGVAFFSKGDYERAKNDLDEALKKNPDDPNAINQKAWMLAVCPAPQYRDGEAAMTLAEKAVKIKTTPNYLDTLAAVSAENGRYREAAEIQRKVIAMLTQEERFSRLDIYLQRLKTYESGKPWRESAKHMEIADTKTTEPITEKVDNNKPPVKTPLKDKVKDVDHTPDVSKNPTNDASPAPAKVIPAVKQPVPNTQSKPATASKGAVNYPYTIFISTYQDPKISKNKVLKLRQNQDPAFVSHAYFKDSGHWYQIYFGWYKSIKEAKNAAEKLKRRHFQKAIVVEKPYAVQAGKSSSQEALKKMGKDLIALNYPAYRIVDTKNPGLVRVLIGAYSTKTVPDKLINTLKAAGLEPKVVRR